MWPDVTILIKFFGLDVGRYLVKSHLWLLTYEESDLGLIYIWIELKENRPNVLMSVNEVSVTYTHWIFLLPRNVSLSPG